MDEARQAEAPLAWWAAAWGQAGRKIDSYGGQMNRMFSIQSDRMTTTEARLLEEAKNSREAHEGIAQRLDHEMNARQKQITSVDTTLKNIMERLNRLETGDVEPKVIEDEKGGNVVGWVPQHVIFGGWPDNSSKQNIEADAAAFLAQLPASRDLEAACAQEVWRKRQNEGDARQGHGGAVEDCADLGKEERRREAVLVCCREVAPGGHETTRSSRNDDEGAEDLARPHGRAQRIRLQGRRRVGEVRRPQKAVGADERLGQLELGDFSAAVKYVEEC